MKTQVFLIDYENVQPGLLSALALEEVRVFVFVGPQQTKLPFALVEAMQKLGHKAEYVRVTRAGDNALDMHIALYLGRLWHQMPDAFLHVISKDRDYDSILEFLNQPTKRVAKWPSLSEVPALQRFQAKTVSEQVEAALRWLKDRPKNRPASRKTLFNTLLKAVFAERLDEATINSILIQMEKQKALTIDEKGKVTYGSALGGSVG